MRQFEGTEVDNSGREGYGIVPVIYWHLCLYEVRTTCFQENYQCPYH